MPEREPFSLWMVILPCLRSTLVRWSMPISEARNPWRYARRKRALSRLSLITAKSRFSSSWVRNCILPEPRLVLGLCFLEVFIHQTE
jgi:hypothetical protein